VREPRGGEAYDAFFKASWGGLFGQAYVLTGNQELAQDLTQEALLRAWKHWDRIGGFDSPDAWTRQVLHHLCIQSWRRSRPRRSTGQTEMAQTGMAQTESVPADPMPDDHLQLAEAMRSLPGDQARALLLHDGLGMTVAATAQELGVPEGTVKSWLSRSRRIVAANLTRSDRDPSRR
jgi:RNA polymerase sigma-70 factor (ECF subfamily)